MPEFSLYDSTYGVVAVWLHTSSVVAARGMEPHSVPSCDCMSRPLGCSVYVLMALGCEPAVTASAYTPGLPN